MWANCDSIEKGRMKVSILNLLEPCYELVEYAKKILSLAGVLYLVTWLKIFTSLRGKGWSDVLLMIRLLFTVSVSKGNLERMLYKLKLVQTVSVARLVSNVSKIFWELWKRVAVGKLSTQFQQ